MGRACRIATLVLLGLAGGLRVHNVHIDHSRVRDLQALRRATRLRPQAHHLILGDFNFVSEGADSMDPTAGSETRTAEGENVATWLRLFPDWTEMLQPEMIHRGRERGWARLDRCCSNLSRGFWMSMHVATSVGPCGDAAGHLSDHCPLLARWSRTSARSRFLGRIPEWVLQSPRWHAKLTNDQEDMWARLAVVKEHMRLAARKVMLEEPHCGYRDVGYQLSLAMGNMRCMTADDEVSLRRMVARSPAVRSALERPRGLPRSPKGWSGSSTSSWRRSWLQSWPGRSTARTQTSRRGGSTRVRICLGRLRLGVSGGRRIASEPLWVKKESLRPAQRHRRGSLPRIGRKSSP